MKPVSLGLAPRTWLMCMAVLAAAGGMSASRSLGESGAAPAWIAAICSGVSTMLSSAASASRPATTVRPLSCEKLPNAPGMSVTTALVTFPPNAHTPAHRHPGSVSAFVVKGHVRSQLAGTPA